MSRILVVDDKEMMRDSVATLLGRRGHAVVAVPSAAQAVVKIGEKRPDAVVTDLQMPDMNGLELLEAIRKIDDSIPVVFMTAYGTVETAVDAMRKGSKLQVKGMSARGTETADVFSLAGFSAAMKAISDACGVK